MPQGLNLSIFSRVSKMDHMHCVCSLSHTYIANGSFRSSNFQQDMRTAADLDRRFDEAASAG